MLIALWVVALELVQLNRSLAPLERIPVVSAVDAGHPTETRAQRIDRVARQRLQLLDDDAAVEQRLRELRSERATPPSAK